jgi:hypothetical protein
MSLISLSWSDVITFGELLLSFQHNFLRPSSSMTSTLEEAGDFSVILLSIFLHTLHIPEFLMWEAGISRKGLIFRKFYLTWQGAADK